MDYQVLALVVCGQLIAMLMIHRLFKKIAEERIARFEAWQMTLASMRQTINDLQALRDAQGPKKPLSQDVET